MSPRRRRTWQQTVESIRNSLRELYARKGHLQSDKPRENHYAYRRARRKPRGARARSLTQGSVQPEEGGQMIRILMVADSRQELEAWFNQTSPLLRVMMGKYNQARSTIRFGDEICIEWAKIHDSRDVERLAGRSYDYVLEVGRVDPELTRQLRPWIRREPVAE